MGTSLRTRTAVGWVGLLLALGRTPSAGANDASFFGDGATVYALKESRVSMQKEKVVVRFDRERKRQRWVADCTFTFQNGSDQEFEVQMGFPDWKAFGDSADKSPWAIDAFEVEVDGQPVQPVHKEVDRRAARGLEPLPPGMEADYQGAYTWPVRFAPRATVVVRNRYAFGGLSTNGPFRDLYRTPGFPGRSLFWHAGGRNRKVGGCDFDDGLVQRLQYIVTTARTWGGPIGEADIAIELPPGVLPHQVVPSPRATSIDGGMVRWHRTRWKPDRELSVYVTVPIGEDCKRPALFDSEEQARAWIRFARANGVKRDAVELVRDAYLARRGLRFPDEARNALFADMISSGAFDPPEPYAQSAPFTAREGAIIALLDAFARSLPRAAP